MMNYLLDSWVISAILKLLSWVDCVNILLVSHDVFLVLSLRDVSQHGRVLRLGEGQLVMDKIPNLFT